MKQKTVAIIHFNTPELTEAAILSLRKHGGEDYKVVVFDNSTDVDFPAMDGLPARKMKARPFTKKMKGVEVIDNTKGQVIDFAAELAKYPDRTTKNAQINDWGSAKHIWTVQKLWELIPEGFVLMESDILLKKPIDNFFDERYSVVGYCQKAQPGNRFNIGRMLPMLCWMNVPMLTREGARYFDPERSWMLHPGDDDKRNWYDTGACLLDDIMKTRPRLKGLHVDIRDYVVHLGSASWKERDAKAWLDQHCELWEPTPRMRGMKNVAICAIGRMENRYAVEWVEHYNKLGVDKIFIYDNNRVEDGELFQDVLYPYVEAGFVEIIPCHNRPNYQCAAYTDCYAKHGNEYAWIGFLDFDEFLRWNGKKKIATMFAKYDADCVLINWRTMTDNGLVHYDPRPVAERFTEEMQPDKAVKFKFPENNHVKSFVRGGMKGIIFDSPHFPKNKIRFVNASGKPVNGGAFTDFDWSVMRIDHYWTKSAEEWRDVKLSREWPLPQSYTDNFMKQQAEYFFAVNERTPEKEAIVCR